MSDQEVERPTPTQADDANGPCSTRALKNVAWIREHAPDVFKGTEPPNGWESIFPLNLASQMHRGTPEELEGLDPRIDIQLLSVLEFPDVSSTVTEPLFSGTLHFVQINFTVDAPPAPPATILSASTTDLLVAISYAERAASQISKYADQYGNNAIAISPEILQFDATPPLTSEVFCKPDLERWVNEIRTANGLPGCDAVAILNTSTLVDGNANPSTRVPSYHAMADIAYLYVDVSGNRLTIDDSANVYALFLSHEIAEMTVDPASDLHNPEVCDPCAQGIPYRAFFDAEGNYINTEQSFPPGFAYEFFINAIVRPGSATGVVNTKADCAYPPPPQQG